MQKREVFGKDAIPGFRGEIRLVEQPLDARTDVALVNPATKYLHPPSNNPSLRFSLARRSRVRSNGDTKRRESPFAGALHPSRSFPCLPTRSRPTNTPRPSLTKVSKALLLFVLIFDRIDGGKDTKVVDVREVTFKPKVLTFEEELLREMAVEEALRPARKTFWY